MCEAYGGCGVCLGIRCGKLPLFMFRVECFGVRFRYVVFRFKISFIRLHLYGFVFRRRLARFSFFFSCVFSLFWVWHTVIVVCRFRFGSVRLTAFTVCV